MNPKHAKFDEMSEVGHVHEHQKLQVSAKPSRAKSIVCAFWHKINDILNNQVFPYSFVVNGKRRGNKQDDYEFLPHHYSGDKVVVLSIFATLVHLPIDEKPIAREGFTI